MKNNIHAFDTLFTSNHIQMYKLLLPYMDPSLQKNIAIYIKYMELQYTMFFFKEHPSTGMHFEKSSDIKEVFEELLPLCSPKEKEYLSKYAEMFTTMDNIKEMMETVSTLKQLFPEGFSFQDMDPTSPDFMQMFQMFQK